MTDEREYLAALQPADLAAARRLCARALDAGEHAATIVDTVLAPAQVEVGRRWHANEWTVAQEHAATAVTDAVLAELALGIAGSPTQPGRIVTGCAEGEWHTMPIRMLDVGLKAAGYDVVSLGPSLPSAQMGEFLADLDPIALLLNCTLPTNLAGARRTIEAAHSAGVPVIVGGRAFGLDRTRANAIGADAWAATVQRTFPYLRSWTRHRPLPARPAPLTWEHTALEYPSPGLVEDCFQQLLDDVPRLRDLSDAQQTRTREDVAFILQFCSATLLTADHTLFDEFTEWLIQHIEPQHVPATTVESAYRAIAHVLGGGYPATVALLGRHVENLTGKIGAERNPTSSPASSKPTPAPTRPDSSDVDRFRAQSTNVPWSVIVLEDNQDDFDLLIGHLGAVGIDVIPQLVDTEEGYRRALRGKPDVILADYMLTAFDGDQALAIRNELASDVPFILVSGYLTDTAALQLIRRGATDFLLKDRLARLGPAVVAAVTSHRRERQRMTELKGVLDGSVAALSEALALANPPAFARALRIRGLAQTIAAGMLGVDPVTIGTITLLSQLGALTLPVELATKLHEGRNVSVAERQVVQRLPTVAVGLLAAIPGLDEIRFIIMCQDMHFDPSGPVPVEARILRLAIAYDRMDARGVPNAEALRLLRTRESLYGADCIDALERMRPHDEDDIPPQRMTVREVPIGWTLASDVVSANGVLLIGRGHPVSEALRQRLHALAAAGTIRNEIWVRRPNSGSVTLA